MGAADVAFHLILSTTVSSLDKVETSDAAWLEVAHIGVELDASTNEGWLVVGGILSLVLTLHEDGFVGLDVDSVAADDLKD